MRERPVASWCKPDRYEYGSHMFEALVNQEGGAKRTRLSAARILEQLCRRLPSSFANRKLFADAATFLRPERSGREPSLGIGYGEYDAPESCAYPLRAMGA
eukprot:7310216-Alexandrium_andersonii.AAC.1